MLEIVWTIHFRISSSLMVRKLDLRRFLTVMFLHSCYRFWRSSIFSSGDFSRCPLKYFWAHLTIFWSILSMVSHITLIPASYAMSRTFCILVLRLQSCMKRFSYDSKFFFCVGGDATFLGMVSPSLLSSRIFTGLAPKSLVLSLSRLYHRRF